MNLPKEVKTITWERQDFPKPPTGFDKLVFTATLVKHDDKGAQYKIEPVPAPVLNKFVKSLDSGMQERIGVYSNERAIKTASRSLLDILRYDFRINLDTVKFKGNNIVEVPLANSNKAKQEILSAINSIKKQAISIKKKASKIAKEDSKLIALEDKSRGSTKYAPRFYLRADREEARLTKFLEELDKLATLVKGV